jgi:hypothetical protein
VQFNLRKILGDIFDEDIAFFADVGYFLFKSESPALFSTYLKISDLFAHFDVIFKLDAGDFHKSFEKLFLDVPVNNWNIVENDPCLFFHHPGKPMAGVLYFW